LDALLKVAPGIELDKLEVADVGEEDDAEQVVVDPRLQHAHKFFRSQGVVLEAGHDIDGGIMDEREDLGKVVQVEVAFDVVPEDVVLGNSNSNSNM